MEIAKDESDNENVIHREGKLDEIASNKFQRFLLPAHWLESHGEKHRQAEPDRTPNQRFFEGNNVSATMKYPQIQRQENQYACNESSPMPTGDCYQSKHNRHPAISAGCDFPIELILSCG